MPRCSGNFLSHLFIRAWNFTKSRTLPSLFFLSWEIFENGWLLTAFSEQLRKVDFDVFQFSTIAISFSCYFYNGKLNVKKTFLQIALLESTRYRISMSKQFLRGSYSGHFQWFAQAKWTTCFHNWLTTKIVLKKDFVFHVQEKS